VDTSIHHRNIRDIVMSSRTIRPVQSSLAFLRKTPPKAHTTPIRFGRDTIFERNNALQDFLERKTTTPLKDEFTVSRVTHGRVCRDTDLPHLLEQAKAEYTALETNPNADQTKKGMAGIKLANLQLADDNDNKAAFALLKKSLDLLNPRLSGFSDPAYIHGLYNRGCYVLNNVLHQTSIDLLGQAEMEDTASSYEGLTTGVPKDPKEAEDLKNQILEGLPFLDKAITLSAGLKDQNIAYIEYQSAKGEAMHALSHLAEDTIERNDFDVQALVSFKHAWDGLNSIEPKDYTPQHRRLKEKLGDVKIMHMCLEPEHIPRNGYISKKDKEFCVNLLKDMGDDLSASIVAEFPLKNEPA
jgi:hypothetical protein